MSAFQIFTQPSQQALDTAANVLSGATLTFTLTGTSTPTNAYSDSALTTPVANPLSANAAGVWAPVFLDPAITYRIVLKTAAGAVLQTWDPANESIIGYFTQQIVGHLLYPRTQAEINASVTPVNYFYPPLYVDRYGTNTTPGTTSMRAAFQAAIDTAKQGGGTIKYGATSPYLIDGALNLTNAVGGDSFSYTIKGEGIPGAYTANAPYRPTLIMKHTGHGFDCTGCKTLDFENVTVTTDPVTYPKTCWLLARNSDKSSQFVKFRNCRVLGNFSDAVVYNYGSEDDQYSDPHFFNYAGTSGACTMRLTATNIHSLTSTFTTIATGAVSTIDHRIFGGQLMNFSSQADADVIFLDAIASLKIYGAWMMAGTGAVKGRSLVYINTANGSGCSNCVISGVTGENPGVGLAQDYGVRFGNEAVATASYWTIEDSALPNSTLMVSAASNVTCDSFHLSGLSNQSTGGGINIAGTLQNSHLDELANNIFVGTLNDNVLNVSINNLTWTTLGTGNYFAGTTLQTWTPGLGAFTLAGPGSTSNATAHYHGRQVTVEAVFSGYTTFSIGAGGAMTGLPIANSIGAGEVIVMNLSTPALIGMGKVNGTSLIMPGIAAGANQVGIRATYFVT